MLKVGNSTKPEDIFNLSLLLLEVLFRYVQLKMEIPESRYNNEIEKFLKATSLLRSEIPVELLQLVKGIEIWLTVSFYSLCRYFYEYLSCFNLHRLKSK